MKHKVASSHEVGMDLEHCFSLHSQFAQFAVDTQDQGNKLVLSHILRCDRMISRGHKNRSDIALAKDRVNEAWADLLEMIETRQLLLKSSLDMHRFMSDAQVSVIFPLYVIIGMKNQKYWINQNKQ